MSNFLVGLGVVVFLVLSALGVHGCREYRVDRCEDKGGQAVVPPWFSEEPAAVSCIVVPDEAPSSDR